MLKINLEAKDDHLKVKVDAHQTDPLEASWVIAELTCAFAQKFGMPLDTFRPLVNMYLDFETIEEESEDESTD